MSSTVGFRASTAGVVRPKQSGIKDPSAGRDRIGRAVTSAIEGLETRVLLSAVIRSAAGASAAAIMAARDQFRVDLGGGTVAAPNGSFGGLRREINWGGV